ncbi:hypothetical protein HKD37_12G034214 [Glycine soja]
MATPHNSAPPSPLTGAASHLPSNMKRTRKATHLRSLATRPIREETPLVHVDPMTKKADSPHRKKLRTYLGIIALEFHIPEGSDLMTKKKILQIVGEWWRQFKSDLTSKLALAVDKDNVDDTICKECRISKENWAQFCQSHRDPSSEKQNNALRELSRGGYEFLENKLMEKKKRKQLEEVAKFGSTDTKMVRTKKIGQMTSKEAKEIAEKIEQASQGSFVTHGRQDVLTPRTSRTSSSMAPEDLEQLTQQIRDQLEDLNFNRKCNHKDSHDLLSLRLVLQLLVLAQRRVVLILQGTIQTRVGVEEVRDAHSPIPVPTKEVQLVGQTINTFISWPTHLVKRLSAQIDRIMMLMIPLYLMTLTIPQLFLKLLQVIFPLYMKHDDLSKRAHDGQCLNIFVIQLWILYMTETSMRARNADVYGFLEPQSIQRSEQSQFESESYIKNKMPNNYLKGIINRSVLFFNTFELALVGNINILIVQYASMFVLNNALKGLDDTSQSKSKAATRWIVVKCNRQKVSIECEYYVMHWIPLEPERLKALRIQWATYYLKVKNETISV